MDISNYSEYISKLAAGKEVKFYNVKNDYLVFGGGNYQLTPALDSEIGHKRAYFIVINDNGSKKLYPNYLYSEFSDGGISSDILKELSLNGAFDFSDNSGSITNIVGAEVDDSNINNVVVSKKGRVELNGKKFEVPAVQNEASRNVQPAIPVNSQPVVAPVYEQPAIPRNSQPVSNPSFDVDEILSRIAVLEESDKKKTETISALEDIVIQQQSLITHMQQQMVEMSNLMREAVASKNPVQPVEPKKDISVDAILNEYSGRSI